MRATSRQLVRVASAQQKSWQSGGRAWQQAAAAAAAQPHAPIHMASRDRDDSSAVAQQRRRLAEPRVTLAMVPDHARWIHMTARQDSAIVAAGIGLAATAYGAQMFLKSYNEIKNAPPPEETEEENKAKATADADAGATSTRAGAETGAGARANAGAGARAEAKNKKKKEEGGQNFFDAIFGGPKNFWEGGFEDKMTRREAAQILGIRESAKVDNIKKAHRLILMANHPDKGGSPYVATKINEAKELLLKGRK